MSLNRKGYLTVEVILASVAAITIAFFLMEITIKLVNTTDDAYVETELLTDKALIIENIKSRLEEDIKEYNYIRKIKRNKESKSTVYYIYFKDRGGYDKISVSSNKISYGIKKDNGSSTTTVYEKTLNNSLEGIYIDFGSDASLSFTLKDSWYTTQDIPSGKYLVFTINADNKFTNDDFKADIIVYNKEK